MKTTLKILGIAFVNLLATTVFAQEAKWYNFNGKFTENTVSYTDKKGGAEAVCRVVVPTFKNKILAGVFVGRGCIGGFKGGPLSGPTQSTQILDLKGTSWVGLADGKFPENAVVATTLDDKPIYICRGKSDRGEPGFGSTIDGQCWIHSSVRPAVNFEVLVAPAGTKIVEDSIIIPGAPRWAKNFEQNETVMVTKYLGRIPLFVCRNNFPNGVVKIGTLVGPECMVFNEGKSIKAKGGTVDVLAYRDSTWAAVKDGVIPKNAYVYGGSAEKPTYICRGKGPDGNVYSGELLDGTCTLANGNLIKTSGFDIVVSK